MPATEGGYVTNKIELLQPLMTKLTQDALSNLMNILKIIHILINMKIIIWTFNGNSFLVPLLKSDAITEEKKC
jgi:hypothetical protein